MRLCEGPGGQPTLFWAVATGLGCVVGKKGAGDGGLHIKIDSYLLSWGILLYSPRNMYIQ